MKRLGLLVSLVLLSVVGTTTTAQAYYLDTPHNESNGIYCFTCHYQLKKSLNYTGTGGDPDYTFKNAICLMCHAASSTHVNKGPAKVAHSSANTTETHGPWTTECTQCHDVHSQGQLDYATTDSAALFLASGQFDTSTGPKQLTFWPSDADGGVCKNVVQPTVSTPCGTTTIGISPSITAAPDPDIDWSLTANWGNKGGQGSPGRGLVLVPSKANPNETFEIISVTNNVLKVKGKMTSATNLGGTVFGVIYGQSIKSFIMPNGGTTINDLRDVKFFKPGLIAGDAGGYVDLTPGETAPKGLCQACHVSTVNWTSDGTNNDHNPGLPCGGCHIISTGGGNEVIKDHTTYISDTTVGTVCLPCHAYVNNNPDKHSAGCSTCHTMGSPTLALNTINNNQVTSETLGVTVLNSLLGAGYTYTIFPDYVVPRLKDSDGTDIQPVAHGGNAVFNKIGCNICHPAKPGLVGTGAHGGHLDTDFGWDQVCRDCHDPSSTLKGYKDIHGNGTQATCALCHAQSGLDDGTYAPRRTGTDGTAEGMFTTSTCISCHLAVNTSGGIHHDSVNTCTFCHVGATHGGNHTNLVRAYVNCNTCHAPNAGTGSTSPIDANYLVLDDPKLHDSCLTCHKLTAGVVTLKTIATDYPGPYPSTNRVNAMPAGTSASNDGGGYCNLCHGEYFASHTHSHATSVSTSTSCSSCHTGNAVSAVHANNCDDCHNMVTGARVNGAGVDTYLGTTNVGDATLNAGAGGNCTVCHPAYFAAHLHPHLFTTVNTSCATNCHATSKPATSDALPASATPYTAAGQVHSRLGCTFCHLATTGLRTSSALTYPAATACVNCHTETWTAMHTGKPNVSHTTTTARVTITAGCATCHANTRPGTSDARIAVTANSPFQGGTIGNATEEVHRVNGCATCHNADGSNRIGPFPKATSVTRGACAACHATWVGSHDAPLVISHNVTTTPLCSTTCHTGDTVSAVHLNNCDDCHNPTTGARVNGAAYATSFGGTLVNVGDATLNGGAGGTCLTCHPGYFDAHRHNHANFTVTTTCATNCHAATDLAGSDARWAATSPWTAAGQVHATGCVLCHDTALSGALKGSAIGKANNASCAACHVIAWDTMHTAKTGVSHAGHVDTLAACTSCHPSTAGGASGVMPVDPATNDTADRKHNSCLSCHNADGSKKSGNTTYGNLPIASTGNCGTCHGPTYFDSHLHHTSATNTVSYNAVSDLSNGAGCNSASCHDEFSLATWAGILSEHKTGCARCHSYTVGTDPVVATNTLVLAYNTTVNCLTCHAKSAAHGGHSLDFAKTTTCTTSPCHQGTSVLVDIHGNGSSSTCGMCHNGTPTRLNVGPVAAYATFGIDGDADGATGAAPSSWASYDCLSCHAAGTYTNNFTSTGGIHHVNKNSNVTCATAGCHTASKLSHTTSVATDSTCSSCHDGAAGGTARNAITAPYIGTGSPNEVHYKVGTGGGCDACHTLQAAPGSGGILRTAALPANLVLSNGLNEAWVNGTNGGGNCSACHKGPAAAPYFDSHAAINHTAFVSGTALLCVDCHTATAGTTLTVPCDVGDNKKHDSCATCHLTTTGLLKSKAVDYPASTRIETISAGSNLCTDCHGVAYFSNTRHSATHDAKFYYDTIGTGVNADVLQANGTAGCGPCHTTLADFTSINTEHLSDCNKCHTATRDINETAAVGTSVRLWIADKSAETTTETYCRTCHVPNWANSPDHAVIDHVGLGKVTNSAQCNGCHDKAGLGTNAHYINTMHNYGGLGCNTCHVDTAVGNYALVNKTTGGTRASQSKNYEAVNPTGGTCVTCHDAYGTNFQTAHWVDTHATRIGTTASCVTCHTGNTVSSTLIHKNTCTTCHTNVTTDGRLLAGTGAGSPFAATAVGNATLHEFKVTSTCATCHASRASTFTNHLYTTPHSTLVVTTPGCNGCHTGDIISGANTHKNTCTTCHLNMLADGRLLDGTAAGSPYAATAVGSATGHVLGGASSCATCHTARATDFTTHLATTDHDGLVATAAVETPSQSDDCNDCHTLAVVSRSVGNTHNSNCLDCHTNTTNNGTLVTGAGAATYLGTTNIGSATGHTLGAATSTCITCHVSTYFSATATPKHTSASHSVTVAGDTSGGTLCDGCHTGMATWANIVTRHDNSPTNVDVCKVCHDSTRTANVLGPRTSVQNVITFNSGSINVVSCLECHSDKSAGHGGHAVTDFAWTAPSTTSCGAAVCHNAAANTNVVTQIHGNAGTIVSPAYTHYGFGCRNCHSIDAGGNGNTIGQNGGGTGYTGDARIIASGGPANDTTHTETCMICHTLTIPQIHHNRDMTNVAGRNVTPAVTSRVQAGQCQKCHTDGAGNATYNYLYKRGTSNDTGLRPPVTPCEYCHLEVSATGFKVKIFRISRILATTNTQSVDPWIGSYTHVFENKMNTTPGSSITDWGVCFYCHGSTGVEPRTQESGATSAARILPKHAFYPAMQESSEWDAKILPRVRNNLHPGVMKYKLMATKPNVQAITSIVSTAAMNNRNGGWNDKLYNVGPFDSTANGAIVNSNNEVPKTVGKGSSLVVGFLGGIKGAGKGDTMTPVTVKSPQIPYTIGSVGPYGKDIPAVP